MTAFFINRKPPKYPQAVGYYKWWHIHAAEAVMATQREGRVTQAQGMKPELSAAIDKKVRNSKIA
jgi:hypothetical protein